MNTTSPYRTAPTPLDNPRALAGVLTRRVLASFIDVFAITAIVVVGAVVLTVLTFGLWILVAYALPVIPIVAVLYVAMTMSGPSQATYGMRLAGIRLERLDGARIDGAFAALHSFLFWISVSFLTPLVLLIGLFTNRRQLGHDLLLGTVVVRSDRSLR